MSYEPQWYVVHTYSGYENKVKANIEKIVENRGMQDQIFEVIVPIQDTVEIKNGQKKNVQRKVYPGYVLLKMIMNDDTWYVVRNTRGVTSFVGPGSKPVPLTEDEIANMGIEMPNETIDIEAGAIALLVDEKELDARREKWQEPEAKFKTGYLARYAKMVTSANTGAVLKV